MKKNIFLYILLFIIFIPASFSISLWDLINFFNFDFSTATINVTNYTNSMIDKDSRTD